VQDTRQIRPAVFALGKFAGEPEYLRMDGGEAFAGLEAWIDDAIAFAHQRRGASWRAAFPAAGPLAMMWQPGQDREFDELLCGVIAPSRDAVGRDYPLVIAARFSEALVAKLPQLVPLVFGDFLDAAYATLAEVRSGTMRSAEVFARVRAIALPTEKEVSLAEADYASWCRQTTVGAAWSVIFGGSHSLVRADRALASLVALVVEIERTGSSGSTAIRLPLGGGGSAAAALWLDIARRMARGSRSPSAFWAADGGDLLLTFGRVRSVLAELWCPAETRTDLVNGLDEGDKADSTGTVLSAADAGATMHDWLDSFVPSRLPG
jgi:type VI secretion system protein ImpM